MKAAPSIAILALAASACATDNAQVARADCKVVPITTASAAGVRPRKVDPLEQRQAEMQLASSDFRMRQLRERGQVNNNVEDALRDCY